MNVAVRFRPGEDDVHVWQAPLDLAPDALARLRTNLSSTELNHADRFRFDRDQTRYIAARGWLRHLLAGYLGVPPAALVFVHDGYGKPRLAAATGNGLRFNVSHSEDRAVYAVTQGREVGVDIERVQDDFPVEEVARRCFSTSDQEAVIALPADLRVRGYFSCWTRKEAYLKGIGLGLRAAYAYPGPAVSGWLVHSFDVGSDFLASVAVEGCARVPDGATPLQLSDPEPALCRLTAPGSPGRRHLASSNHAPSTSPAVHDYPERTRDYKETYGRAGARPESTAALPR